MHLQDKDISSYSIESDIEGHNNFLCCSLIFRVIIYFLNIYRTRNYIFLVSCSSVYREKKMVFVYVSELLF